jgi:hypothetical protein
MVRALTIFLALVLAAPAVAAQGDVPQAIQGRWVDEGIPCDALGAPVVISATTLVYADGRIDDVVFSPSDGSDGVIRHRAEGEVSNYEYVETGDRLIYHPEGFGMGAAFAMVRCPEPSTTENRCGWVANLAPGEWWLVDRDRTWILSARGDDSPAVVAVMDRVPDFDAAQFTSTGDHYGYGCACMSVVTDTAQDRIIAITSSRRLPLATCEADTALPALADW